MIILSLIIQGVTLLSVIIVGVLFIRRTTAHERYYRHHMKDDGS